MIIRGGDGKEEEIIPKRILVNGRRIEGRKEERREKEGRKKGSGRRDD